MQQDRFAERRRKLVRLARSKEAGAFLITHPLNVRYLTGFTGEDAYLFVHPQRSLLLSDGRFGEQIEEECPGLEAYLRRPGELITEAAAKAIRMFRTKRLAFECAALSVADWETMREKTKKVEWLGLRGAVESLRIVKDREEVRQIEAAIAIAEAAFWQFCKSLRAGDAEKSLADRMEMLLRQAGGQAGAFPTIVAMGERSARPHAVPTDGCLHDGGFLLVDWGARGGGYHSDLTRVLAARKISPKLARVYEVALAAQNQAIEAIRPGVTGEEVDAAARKVIADAGLGRRFTHSVGHGLGLDVHEGPALRRGSKTVLKPGMVVTVEPGIYLRGWGGVRVEDDVLVTKDGARVLSGLPRGLEELTLALGG